MGNTNDCVGEAPEIEKEAKFWLSSIPEFALDSDGKAYYEQTYLNYENPEAMELIAEMIPQTSSMDVAEARIRVISKPGEGSCYIMTVKSDGGEDRQEAEVEVDFQFANDMVRNFSKGHTVVKARTKFPMSIPGLIVEVDSYGQGHAGLVTAEIEQDLSKQERVYAREELANALREMVGDGVEVVDVTEDKRFKNKKLAAMERPDEEVEKLIDSVRGDVKAEVAQASFVENPDVKEVKTKFGRAFKNESGQWRFQWNGGRAGTPPECALAAAANGLRGHNDMIKTFCDEVNRALKEAGVNIVLAGGPVNPRTYLG